MLTFIFNLFAVSSALDPLCDRPATFPEDPYNFPVNCKSSMGSFTDNEVASDIVFMEYNND